MLLGKDEFMHIHSPRLIGTFLAFFISGCAVNPDLGKKAAPLSETTCTSANLTFSAKGVLRAGLMAIDLPPGKYSPVSAEIYFETVSSRTQYLETPGSKAGVYSTSLRCREVSSEFTATSNESSVLEGFTRFKSGDFSIQMLNYGFNNRVASSPSLLVSLSADLPSVTPASFSSAIAAYWNAGYKFVHRSGNNYEWIGTRVENDAKIQAKASFIRSDLPANSL